MDDEDPRQLQELQRMAHEHEEDSEWIIATFIREWHDSEEVLLSHLWKLWWELIVLRLCNFKES